MGKFTCKCSQIKAERYQREAGISIVRFFLSPLWKWRCALRCHLGTERPQGVNSENLFYRPRMQIIGVFPNNEDACGRIFS
jgi:hypothetical protein